MEKIYEKVLYLKNKPLFEEIISYENHKIFYKYTSNKYYKYIFNLLDILCKKSPYENKSHIFHLSLSFIFKILYKSENTPYLSNLDLITLNCFSLGIKSLTKQKLFPPINRLKKIYEEKFNNYSKKEIIEGEIICLKLLNYDINILTPFEFVEYIVYDYSNISFKKQVFEKLKNLILNEVEYVLYNKPFDIATKCVNDVNNNLLLKEPKIITKKIISTKTLTGKNVIKKFSSSENMINKKDESYKGKNTREAIEKLKKKTNISSSKYKPNYFINNIKINIKCSPEKIYYKKNCNYNNIANQVSSELIIKENNSEKNISKKSIIFKKKINKDSMSKSKYIFGSNNVNKKNKYNPNEICQKKVYLNNNKKSNKSYYEKNALNMSNTQFFKRNSNYKDFQVSKENDQNYMNLYLYRNNSNSNNKIVKYSVESEKVNDYKNSKALKYDIETKNIKLGFLNKKYLGGSDYKISNNGNRLTQMHSLLNSSSNIFDNSACSKDEILYENQSLGNYYIKW